jgi:hypothetical protein
MAQRSAIFICLFMAMLTSSSVIAADGLEVPLWDGGAPATAGKPMHETVNNWGGVEGTYQPELIVYLPEKDLNPGYEIEVVVEAVGGGSFKAALRPYTVMQTIFSPSTLF